MATSTGATTGTGSGSWLARLSTGDFFTAAGSAVIRYGLAIVVAWIGLLKFTSYEAEAIAPLVANSPLTAWLYSIFSVQAFAGVLGAVEVVAAVLIATYALWPRVSAVGSAVTSLLFLGTLTFLITTPPELIGGFPFLSVGGGQFLIKDLVLLGASLSTLGEALRAARPTVP